MVSQQVRTLQGNLEMNLLLFFNFLIETKSEDARGIEKMLSAIGKNLIRCMDGILATSSKNLPTF